MKVSVIIAAYNVERFISRAIASVREQTHQDWEVIVVDDTSTDNTCNVVEAIAQEDARVRLIRRARNGGPSAARNDGLDVARGKWIAVLDADDAWRPDRLERLLAIAATTSSDFVADNQVLFDDSLQREVGTAFNLSGAQVRLTLRGLLAGEYEGACLNLGMLKPILRLDFIKRCGLRYNTDLRYFEDYFFYSELIINGISAVVTQDAFYIYTTPVGILSNTKSLGTRTTDYIPTRFPVVDGLVNKYRYRLPGDMKPLLREYWAIARRRWVSNRITSLRKRGGLFSLALFMLAHPVGSAIYVQRSRTFRTLRKPFTR